MGERGKVIDPDGWYTTTQVAKLLACGAWSIRERLKKGVIAGRQLPAIGGGSPHWRVPGGEVLRLIGVAALAGQTQVKASEFDRQNLEAMKRLGLA